MKRSNRLVLLVGVFLAIVAFIGILLLQGQGGGPQQPEVVTELPTVIATQDIPLGTAIRADQVTTEVKSVDARDPDAFGDVSQVIGKIVRQPVVAGAAITAATLSGGQQGQILDIQCPPTQRCMAVQVDQVSGVGTVIKTGDYVDMVVGFNVAVLSPDQAGTGFQVVPGIDGTTVKLILQGLQVMGTLLPPPTTTTAPPPEEGQPAASPGTTLSGQQEIVILSVSAQQSEVIKFAQLKASDPPTGITLVLRSAQDFIDPATNLPFPNGPEPDTTTGIIFRVLVDQYGVLPPNIIEVVLPTPEP